MDIIICGAIVCVLTAIFKAFGKKIDDKKVARSAILLFGAACALGAALVYQQLPGEVIEYWAKTWAMAIGFYEVVYKGVIKPALQNSELL